LDYTAGGCRWPRLACHLQIQPTQCFQRLQIIRKIQQIQAFILAKDRQIQIFFIHSLPSIQCQLVDKGALAMKKANKMAVHRMNWRIYLPQALVNNNKAK
jgi:hypothetical protein